jgi:PAS domain S-box-containing protein
MKIANKINLAFLATALILTSIAAPIFYMIATGNLKKSIYNNLATVVNSRANHIETYLEMLEASVGQLSKSVVLENLLKVNGKEDSRWRPAFAQAMEMLARTKEANPAIAEFLLMDRTGKVAASSNESSIGLDKSTDTIFLGGLKGIYIKDVYYSQGDKEPLMAVATPFLDSQTGQFLGVLAARVRLNDLNNIVREKTGMGDTGEVYIVNKYGFMVTPTRFKEDVVLKQKVDTQNVRRARLHESREHPLSEKEIISIFPDYRGVQVLGAHEYIPQMGWAVLAEIDAKEAFAPLAKLRLIFLAILLTVPIAAWLLGIFLAKLITDPLHKLHKGTEVIGSGNLDYKVGTNAKDEVGQLSRAFDEMVENLKKNTTSIENLNKEITERKRAQEQVRLAAEEWERTFNSITDWVFVQDKYSNIVRVNKACAEALKMDPKDIIGRKCYDLLHNSDHPWPGCPLEKTKQDYAGHSEEVNDPHIGIPLLVTVSPIFGASGELTGAVHIAKDIAERKKIEQALRDSAAGFRAIFDNANDGIVLADEETKKFYTANNTACQMLGYSPEEIKNLGVTDIHPKEHLAYVLEQFERQVRGEIAVAKDLPVRRKDGSVFYADVNSSLVTLSGRKYLLGLFRDITQRRRAEGALVEAVKQKSEYTSTVSHELRTPLTAIREGIAIVLDGTTGALNAEQKEFLDLAKRNVDRLSRLINAVLDFQKLEAQKMVFDIQENDINELVREVHDTMAPLADKQGLGFTLKLAEGLPRLKFDWDRIVQVLTNLVNNAIKFTEKGSIIIASSRGDNNIEVSVKDSGPGIKEEDMGRLFQQFGQLERIAQRTTGGTGLGLAISKEIIEKHRGKIWVESEFGKGATFRFILPIEVKYKVLVIDDDRDMLNIIKNFLEKEGYGLTCSEKGLDAIEIIGRDRPDLVILDMKLKDTNGYEIIGRLRSKKDTLKIPIIAMSGYPEELIKIEDMLEELALVSIAKPFDLGDLLSIARKLLQRF